MNRLLLIFVFIFAISTLHAQTGYLFVKKGYNKKKRTYTEGDRIAVQVKGGAIFNGIITLLKNDTIYINGLAIPRVDVQTVLLNKKKKGFHVSTEQFLWITGGVALTVAGLTLSEQASFGEAALAGVTIGYGPLLIGYVGSKISFKRKRYKIGKKFRLQMIDFHLPHYRAF